MKSLFPSHVISGHTQTAAGRSFETTTREQLNLDHELLINLWEIKLKITLT